jgi:hypothetical protein
MSNQKSKVALMSKQVLDSTKNSTKVYLLITFPMINKMTKPATEAVNHSIIDAKTVVATDALIATSKHTLTEIFSKSPTKSHRVNGAFFRKEPPQVMFAR